MEHFESHNQYYLNKNPPITRCVFNNNPKSNKENVNQNLFKNEHIITTSFKSSSKRSSTKRKENAEIFIMQFSDSKLNSPLQYDIINTLHTNEITKEQYSRDTMCTICQENFNIKDYVITLKCNHFFHDECLMMWFNYQNKCPICKSYI